MSAGLPKIRLHDRRYTAATLQLTYEVQPKKVQDLLGQGLLPLALPDAVHYH
ncbi:MAG TPA: hypothetical protein VFZ25_10730 [Chloroflexota bacterium]|nr:hypothetical protein [Chloroflexota bacterium]